MASKKSTIIAVAAIISLTILLISLRVTLGLSEAFFLILGAVVAANLAILTWIYIQHRAEKLFERKLVSEGRELRVEYSFLRKVAGVPIKFRYKELEKATDNFQALLGKGSSAYVFKGILDDGTPVAVKRIEGVEHGEKEFKAEVSAIASAQHVNLVRLLGYCSVPGGPRILVYEFVHNGSLDSWIFPQNRGIPNRSDVRFTSSSCLTWDLRYKVAIDVAKALRYLHHDCRSRILHLDVKPENILLDANFRAVVTDFGMSKLMGRDVSRIFTTIRGTKGYLAPEWLLENGISEKSDIYSYGMVLLEIIGGRRNVRLIGNGDNRQRKWSYFPRIVDENMREGKLMEVVDERLLGDGGEVDERQVRILVNVALWCIQENPKLRPNMASVVDMLEERVSMDTPPPTEMIVVDLLAVDREQTNGENRNGVAMQPTNQMENQLPTMSTYSYSLSILSGR